MRIKGTPPSVPLPPPPPKKASDVHTYLARVVMRKAGLHCGNLLGALTAGLARDDIQDNGGRGLVLVLELGTGRKGGSGVSRRVGFAKLLACIATKGNTLASTRTAQ